MPQTVPHFVLYEEQSQDSDLLALHVEPIHSRSSRHDWTIRPHAHPDHHQILLLSAGAGTLWIEAENRPLLPLTILTIPAMAVHAYRFAPATDGFVATLSLPFIAPLLADDPRLGQAFAGSGLCHRLADDGAVALFQALQQEFTGAAPGRRAAIRAHLQLLLVALARLPGRDPPPAGARHRDADIVARYRQQIERGFRQQPGLAELAGALGVTPARLNAACRAVMGRSAMTLMHDRLAIEAKRELLYTERAVGEIARGLGFADPAYFNRFFRRHAGVTPGAFRRGMSTIAVG